MVFYTPEINKFYLGTESLLMTFVYLFFSNSQILTVKTYLVKVIIMLAMRRYLILTITVIMLSPSTF